MSSTAIYQHSLAIGRPRRLGSVLAPARNLYLLYFPVFMIAVGLACWVVETDFMLMVGSVALAIVGVHIFYGLAFQQKPLRVTTLLVGTLALGYGVGTANTWFTLPRSGQDLGPFMHKDPVALTHTMGSILFSMAVVLAVGELLEKPIFGEDFELQLPPQALVFLTAGVILVVVAFAKGSLNFMGAAASEGHISIFSSFAAWLVSSLFAIGLVATLNAKSKGIKVYLALLTLTDFVLIIPLGRRTLLYSIVLAFLALRLGRHRFNWSWTKRIVVAVLLAATLYVTSIGFFYLRLAGYSAGRTHLGILDRVSLAITYFKTKDFSVVQKSFSSNVQTRTFILGFLSELEDYTTRFTPGLGRDIEGQFLAAVPSAFYPQKNIAFGEEGLADELFGSAYEDEANSILTGGVIDFGMPGMILYPLLIAFMLRYFFEFIGQSLPTFVVVFTIYGSFSALLQAENNLTDYFIVIRNGLLFAMVVWFFIALPAFRLRKEN